MYHARIRSVSELDAAAIHPMTCPCADCSANGDPIAHARATRAERLQAALLVGAAVALYAVAALNWRGIADAFAVSL